MTPTAVIQVKQGIGDDIRHLPFIRAIAATEPGGAVTFLTLPSSRAKDLLQAEPCVAEVTYFEHGGSHPAKDWPTAHWKTFVDALRRRTAGSVFLIGGAPHAERAAALVPGPVGAMAINACDLAITEAAGLLRLADLFVGPDSGPMNLAAAGETPAFALFGTTPVLRYSRFIHPIEPEGGQAPDGMTRILPELVLARIEPYLTDTKTDTSAPGAVDGSSH